MPSKIFSFLHVECCVSCAWRVYEARASISIPVFYRIHMVLPYREVTRVIIKRFFILSRSGYVCEGVYFYGTYSFSGNTSFYSICKQRTFMKIDVKFKSFLRYEKTATREKERCFCYFLLTLESPDVLIVPSVGSPM